MKVETKKELLTKNNQPIKTITHQDIYATKDTLGKLQSWISTLEALDKFFNYNNKKEPLSKKEIVQDYHASSQIFGVFFEDFLKRTDILESQLEDLRTREKVRN